MSNAPDDPSVLDRAVDRWDELDGMGFIKAMAAGELPMAPHAELLAYTIVDVVPGHLELSWEVPEALLNPAGIAHGGFLVALLDDAAGLACASKYARFVPQLTVELRSDFVRPVVAGVRHRVIGEVIRHGRSSNLADARIEDPGGGLLARTTGTFLPNRRVIPDDRWGDAGIA